MRGLSTQPRRVGPLNDLSAACKADYTGSLPPIGAIPPATGVLKIGDAHNTRTRTRTRGRTLKPQAPPAAHKARGKALPPAQSKYCKAMRREVETKTRS